MNTKAKKILKVIGIIILVIVLTLAAYIIYLYASYHRIEDNKELQVETISDNTSAGVAFFFSGLECTSEEGDIGQDRIPDARGMWHRFGQGFVRRGDSRTPEEEDIGPGKDSDG